MHEYYFRLLSQQVFPYNIRSALDHSLYPFVWPKVHACTGPCKLAITIYQLGNSYFIEQHIIVATTVELLSPSSERLICNVFLDHKNKVVVWSHDLLFKSLEFDIYRVNFNGHILYKYTCIINVFWEICDWNRLLRNVSVAAWRKETDGVHCSYWEV